MRMIAVSLLCVVGLWCSGCGLGTEVSGWELVPKSGGIAQLEHFPELPITLPGPIRVQPQPTGKSPMQGTYLGKLDYASLFRRSYSAPTP